MTPLTLRWVVQCEAGGVAFPVCICETPQQAERLKAGLTRNAAAHPERAAQYRGLSLAFTVHEAPLVDLAATLEHMLGMTSGLRRAMNLKEK